MMDDDRIAPGFFEVQKTLHHLHSMASQYRNASQSQFDQLRHIRTNLLGPYKVLNPLILENVRINGQLVHSLLDSGCTNTSMSTETMRLCGLTNLMKPYKNKIPEVVAVGGDMKVIGNINLVPATTNNRLRFVFPCQVVEGLVTPLLLGIDFMRTFCKRVNADDAQCSLDQTIMKTPLMKRAFSQISADLKSLARLKLRPKSVALMKKKKILKSHRSIRIKLMKYINPSNQLGLQQNQRTSTVSLNILGQDISAMVDTGCSNTIMTTAVINKMNLIQLTDPQEKLASYVQGAAGKANIIGTVVMVPAKFQGNPLVFPSMVMESDDELFLLGIDFLKAYRCSLDVRNSVLQFSYEGIPFNNYIL